MAHTLLEQTLNLSENIVDDINNLFVQQFGYTENGKYYFSPIDTNFGVRWYIDSMYNYLYGYVTFDGGATEAQLVYSKKDVTAIYYQSSKNEKVISLRIKYNTSYIADVIVAHDEKNKTVCFKGSTRYGTSPSPTYNYVDMLDYKKIIFNKEYTNSKIYKVNANISNAIYRYPSFNNQCLCSELYGVVNVQTFSSLSDTYIYFNGQIYRVISCCLINATAATIDDYIPHFAFPVSD